MSIDGHEPRTWVLTDVSLVIKSPDLAPDAVTRQLALTPTNTRQPGPDRWDPDGDSDGQWRMQSDEHTSRVFSEQLAAILTAAESKRKEILSLEASGCEVFLAVHGYSSNDAILNFSSEEIKRISDLNIPLEIQPSLSDR
ncbi:DUF4279 domain-containing protein [Streptomyces sp. H27-D2]|uniref:DUF4279 domain-containing protein n=1 Tax=Streptomyces sp. H27-D2 TaxID=3046304 RepID=UPI002DBC7B0C|nr:DUF4279 domain-containing protein [Streptomyces sp. H27-D2]MEC4016980.1 DUF4279 domain-containing protein [Streptomyces sp. H27-D2]